MANCAIHSTITSCSRSTARTTAAFLLFMSASISNSEMSLAIATMNSVLIKFICFLAAEGVATDKSYLP